MDGGAAIVSFATRMTTIEVEQAIFTSIRSPMGEGYRIIASSRGISADEKREIVQCAPSHGSLCDQSPEAAGLASFKLRGGRHCLFFSKAAGKEHTGRGGYRIHTQVLVLDSEAYGGFHFDPFVMVAAWASSDGNAELRTPPTRLEALSLCTGGESVGEAVRGGAAKFAGPFAGQVARVALALLRGECTLVRGVPAAREVLQAALEATPAGVRRALSVSYGLKYSPRRRFDVALTEVTAGEMERIKRDSDIRIIDWKDCAFPNEDPYEGWLGLSERLWAQGRGGVLRRLSDELNGDTNPAILSRIAVLHDDIEQVETADRSALAALRKRHMGESGSVELHARMIKQFHQAAALRQGEIERAEQEAAERAAAARAAQEQVATVDEVDEVM